VFYNPKGSAAVPRVNLSIFARKTTVQSGKMQKNIIITNQVVERSKKG
jgi:hypothetical protein